MIASTSALHLFVAVAIAAPVPVDPTSCAADDPLCSARAYADAARRAESNEQRVRYLYYAHRAYVASRDLCHAKLLIEQALALPPTSLRPRVVSSERETLVEIAEGNVQCEGSRRGKRGRPVALAAAQANSWMEPPAELLRSTPALEGSSVTAMPTSPSEPAQGPSAAASEVGPPVSLTPQTRRQVTPEVINPSADRAAPSPATWRWPDTPPRAAPPGRRLLIAGGVSLAVGLALTGTAAYTGARALDARRTGHDNMELAATSENRDLDKALRAEYEQYGPVAIVTGAVGGAALVAAIVMLCAGARRKSRAAEREPMLMPVRTGMLFTAKF